MHSPVARCCVPRVAPAMAAHYHTESEAVLAEIGRWFAYRTRQLRLPADLHAERRDGQLVGVVCVPASSDRGPEGTGVFEVVLWPGWYLLTTTSVAWLVLDPHQYCSLYRDVDELIPRVVARPRHSLTPVRTPATHPVAHPVAPPVAHAVDQVVDLNLPQGT
jgi:hypothetical protein